MPLTINYRRHFLLLTVGAAILPFVPEIRWLATGGDVRMVSIFAAVGSLHAVAVVLALRSRQRLPKQIVFVALAAALSALCPIAGIMLGSHLGGFGTVILGASVLGAVTYWHLVRAFWIPGLPLKSLGFVAGLCALATPLAFLLAAAVAGFGAPSAEGWRPIADAIPSVAWWLTFSSTVYYFDAGPGRTPADQGSSSASGPAPSR